MPTSKTAAASHVRGSARTVHTQPSEASDSYFSNGAATTTTTAPTPASGASTSTADNTPFTSNASTPNSGSSSSHPLSPLDREYTEPAHDIDIAHQLSKEPTYWSVKGWVQRSVSSSPDPRQEAKDREAKARKFEEVKRDLLASAGRF